MDIDAFSIDPIFMGRLHKHKARPAVVMVSAMLATFIALTYSAAIAGLLYPELPIGVTYWEFLHRFFVGREFVGTKLTLFQDVPSLILAVTVPVSFSVVYGLFHVASGMHAELQTNGCLKFDATDPGGLAAETALLNEKLRRYGKFAGLALLACLAFTVALIAMQSPDVYGFAVAEWWASPAPLRPGFAVWALIGGIGVYAVYIEAVLGLHYVAFLRRLKDDFKFRANPLNPDGFFGWARLRQVFTNLEIGIVLTALSCLGLWLYLLNAFGVIIASAIEAAFVLVVGYVFFGSSLELRRQVAADKREQVLELQRSLEGLGSDRVADLLRQVTRQYRLTLVHQMPTAPIRRSSLILLLIGLLAPMIEIGAAVLQVVNGK